MRVYCLTMNDDIIADLKQFITTTISQQTSEIRGDIGEIRDDIVGIKGDIQRVDQKIDDLSASVAQAIDDSNEETHTQLKNHESRIKKLEAKTA